MHRLTFPDFTVVNASAGSGKTYSLAWRLVQMLLDADVPHGGFRSVLAITFTRNAAAEMKERVLRALKQLALRDADALREIGARVAGDPADIPIRAGSLVDDILSSYGELRVQTIDSFLARVFRSSAVELGFPPGTALSIDAQSTRVALADDIAATITADAGTVDTLLDLARGIGTDADAYTWDPFRTLVDGAGRLLDRSLARPAHPAIIDVRGDMTRLEAEALAVLDELEAVLRMHSWTPGTRGAKSLEIHRSRGVRAAADHALPGIPVTKKELGREYAEAELILTPMLERYAGIAAEYLYLLAAHREAPYAKALAWVQALLARVLRREGRLSLRDMTRVLFDHIEELNLPSVYLALGDRVHHYLVDEFQDTSPVQWGCLHPLFAEALAADGSLFIVGDPKQSIYAWRDADWRIMTSLGPRTFPSAAPRREDLRTNYRSGEHILTFCRELFHEGVPRAGDGAAAGAVGLSTYDLQPCERMRDRGMVRVRELAIDGDDRAPLRASLIDVIDGCTRRGHGHGDILVLARAHDQLIEAAGWLGAQGIRFLSDGALDVRSRTVANELLSLLRFLDTPVDDCSFTCALLGRLFGAALTDAGLHPGSDALHALLRLRPPRTPAYKIFEAEYPVLWERWFDPLFRAAGSMPVYDLLANAVAGFDAFRLLPEEEGTIAQVLDAAVMLESDGAGSLKDFLARAVGTADADIWTMQPPRVTDAVRLMTIHRSKGLQAPVVIVLQEEGMPQPPGVYEEERAGAGDGTAPEVLLLHISERAARNSPRLMAIREAALQRQMTEDMNTLYVALTRAELELHLLITHNVSATERESGVRENVRPPASWLPAGRQRGAEAPAEPRGAAPRQQAAHHLPFISSLAPAADSILSPGETQRGSAVHRALESVRTTAVDPAEIEAVLRREGVADAGALAAIVYRFITSDAGRELFAPRAGRIVHTEREILDAQGAARRVDRLIIDTDSILVVDFKTGGDDAHAMYERQVREYCALLAPLFPGRTLRGAVAYVDRCETREVLS
jgi:ATP-dependent helicase/nuclease subunit A